MCLWEIGWISTFSSSFKTPSSSSSSSSEISTSWSESLPCSRPITVIYIFYIKPANSSPYFNAGLNLLISIGSWSISYIVSSWSKLPLRSSVLLFNSSFVGHVYSAPNSPGLFSIWSSSRSFYSYIVCIHFALVFGSTVIGWKFSSASIEDLLEDFLELTIDYAFEVDNTFSFSFVESLTGQGSVATSILLIFQPNLPIPVIWINRLAFR